MNGKKFALTGAALGMMVLILDSRAATSAAAAGVTACMQTVIPSLFPFFLLSGYLIGSLEPGKIDKAAAKLFHCQDFCGGIILSGLLGGYPLGARLAAEGYRNGLIQKEQASRLLWFCSQAGPAFLFGMVASRFPNPHYAWLLWGIQILSALSVSWIIPACGSSGEVSCRPHCKPRIDPMHAAIRAMAAVCGWVILFSIILDFLQRWILWRFPIWLQLLICGVMELTNGCLLLQTVDSEPLRLLLAAVMLNFGGICVFMQTASLTQGLNIRNYLRGKLLQTAFAAAYSGIILGHWWLLIPVLGLMLFNFLGIIRKNCRFPQPVGV